jgi:tetratricopeptide (TPR) repeat protein
MLYAVVPAVLIACALIFGWRKPWTPGLPSVQVAVANDTHADSEAAQLAAQMAERLTQKLAEMRVFTVFWRGASNARADNLLRVSVAPAAGGLHASLLLVSARGGDQLWGETYESKSLDVWDFVDRASELAVRTLRAQFLGPRQRQRPDDEALRLYARGREEWAVQRLPAILKSADYCQQAIGRDPLFARAHAGLAESELFLASLLPDRAKERVERARMEATRAIELDEHIPEAHAVLGNILLRRDWNFVSAERELMRALELQPGPSAYERWYAIAAELRGHAPAALEELEFGELVNPRSETIQCEIAAALLQLGQPVQAQRKVEVCLAISPGYTIGIEIAGMIREARGDYRAATAIYGQGLHPNQTDNLWRLASLGHAEAMMGDLGEARRILNRILSGRPQTYGRQRSLALLHLALGQTDEVLAELEAANRERDAELPLIALDPRFRPLEGNARYRALLRATGFRVPE